MPAYAAIRAALAATCSTVPGLAGTVEPAQVNPPAAVIMPASGQMLHYETLDGAVEMYLRVILLVSAADDPSGQALMDSYLDTSGPGSVLAAIRADPSLGHTVAYCEVTGASGWGVSDWYGVPYLQCTLLVTVGT